MLNKIKLYLFAAIGAVMAGLALWGKAMSNKAEKYRQKAKQAEEKAEDATELANQQSALTKAQHDARKKTNEALKNAGKTTGTGRDFSRDRMHDHRNKDGLR